MKPACPLAPYLSFSPLLPSTQCRCQPPVHHGLCVVCLFPQVTFSQDLSLFQHGWSVGCIPASPVVGKWHYWALLSVGYIPGKCPRSLQKVPHFLAGSTVSTPIIPTRTSHQENWIGVLIDLLSFPHFRLLRGSSTLCQQIHTLHVACVLITVPWATSGLPPLFPGLWTASSPSFPDAAPS